jgi:hypothetical protein
MDWVGETAAFGGEMSTSGDVGVRPVRIFTGGNWANGREATILCAICGSTSLIPPTTVMQLAGLGPGRKWAVMSYGGSLLRFGAINGLPLPFLDTFLWEGLGPLASPRRVVLVNLTTHLALLWWDYSEGESKWQACCLNFE